MNRTMAQKAGHTRRKAKPGDERFVCFVAPKDAIEAAARKEGWTPECGDGFANFIEIADYEIGTIHATLEAAVEYGRKFVAEGKDYWGSAIVYREVYGPDELVPEHDYWQSERRFDVTENGVEGETNV
jgi:hypothetical protein